MFVGFRFHPRFRSSLLSSAQSLNAPGVPSAEDLDALYKELKQARGLTQDRVEKAETDLETVNSLRAKHEQAKEQERAHRESLARERQKPKKDGGIGKIKREASGVLLQFLPLQVAESLISGGT